MPRQILTLPDLPPALLTDSEGTAAYAPAAHTHAIYAPTDHDHSTLYEPLDSAYTKSEADLRYVNTAGDTMTGALEAPSYTTGGVPLALSTHDHNSVYSPVAHDHNTTYLPLVGGSVMTGLLGPTTTNTRDLGTTTLRWRKLWATDADLSGELVTTSHVGVGTTPQVWNGGRKAVQVGDAAAVWGFVGGQGARFTSNTYLDASAVHRAIVAGEGSIYEMYGGTHSFRSAPNVAAGATQTFTERAFMSIDGTLSLTPTAGMDALLVGSVFRVSAKGPGGPVAPGTGVEAYTIDASSEGPSANGITITNGAVAFIWTTAVSGTFSGLLILNDTVDGFISCWLTGGAALYKIGGHANHVNAVPTAGQTGIYFGGGGYGIALHNNTGATHSYRVMSFRSRNVQ